jgi:hypothetical protein
VPALSTPHNPSPDPPPFLPRYSCAESGTLRHLCRLWPRLTIQLQIRLPFFPGTAVHCDALYKLCWHWPQLHNPAPDPPPFCQVQLYRIRYPGAAMPVLSTPHNPAPSRSASLLQLQLFRIWYSGACVPALPRHTIQLQIRLPFFPGTALQTVTPWRSYAGTGHISTIQLRISRSFARYSHQYTPGKALLTLSTPP